MFDFLADLNPEQHAAATFEAPVPLRIVAGAGTGKTTALAGRVAWLLASGTPPERVLLLTFTRRAARQLLARTETMLAMVPTPRRGAGRVQGGTFHSVAHRTLRRHARLLGLPDGFSVLDTSDATDLFDLVRDQHLGASTVRRRLPRKALLLDLYSRAVNTGQSLSDVIAIVAPWCSELTESIAAMCKEYVVRKRALGLVDFDDLLLYWRAAALDPIVGPQLAAEFDHILVDEYQDVNALQVDVVAALRTSDRRLTVVGDDAQAIYGFRAADPAHLLDFGLAFPDATTITLETNYRSSPQILQAANAVGAQAPTGFRAILRAAEPERSNGDRPQLLRCADEDAQSNAVCDRVLEQREAGLRLRDQAVLFRAAQHSEHLELELSRRAIPYVKYGGLRYLEAAHVKDLLAAFRLADNTRDEVSWLRLLQLLDGVGPATARRVIDVLALFEDKTEADADVLARWPDASALLPTRVRPAANTAVSALAPYVGETVGVHAERLRVAIAPLIESAYPDATSRLADLDVLVSAAGSCARLADVAADYALEPPRSTGDFAGPPLIDEDWLILSTVHSAKGLEWDVVHLLHAADGNFPSDMALGTAQGLEEERRLFYVAITRPRRALNVYVPLRYHHHPRAHDDAHSWSQPSRFLAGDVTHCFDERWTPNPDLVLPVANMPAVVPAADVVAGQLDALWA
ncbi:MAG TPA: ATP-dependent helicase [Acidothermaceae bacterium]